MRIDIRRPLFALVTCAALGASYGANAQSTHDEKQQLIAQIQNDKRTIVLDTLELDDAQVQVFTPIYDQYQVEHKKLFDRAADLLDLYASNYQSMSDDVAKKILKDWIKLQDDDVDLTRKYARRLEKVLPPTKVVRFVQVENKMDTLLKLRAVVNIPLAR